MYRVGCIRSLEAGVLKPRLSILGFLLVASHKFPTLLLHLHFRHKRIRKTKSCWNDAKKKQELQMLSLSLLIELNYPFVRLIIVPPTLHWKLAGQGHLHPGHILPAKVLFPPGLVLTLLCSSSGIQVVRMVDTNPSRLPCSVFFSLDADK